MANASALVTERAIGFLPWIRSHHTSKLRIMSSLLYSLSRIKEVYGYVNNTLELKSYTPSLNNKNGILINVDKEKANLLDVISQRMFKVDDGIGLNL